jgi:hypothetical protein
LGTNVLQISDMVHPNLGISNPKLRNRKRHLSLQSLTFNTSTRRAILTDRNHSSSPQDITMGSYLSVPASILGFQFLLTLSSRASWLLSLHFPDLEPRTLEHGSLKMYRDWSIARDISNLPPTGAPISMQAELSVLELWRH